MISEPGAGDDPPALDIQGVSHRFGAIEALRDVSFRVGPGSFCALLGINGAGKTTLFSLITRLYDSTSGRISVDGFDARRQPGRARWESKSWNRAANSPTGCGPWPASPPRPVPWRSGPYRASWAVPVRYP